MLMPDAHRYMLISNAITPSCWCAQSVPQRQQSEVSSTGGLSNEINLKPAYTRLDARRNIPPCGATDSISWAKPACPRWRCSPKHSNRFRPRRSGSSVPSAPGDPNRRALGHRQRTAWPPCMRRWNSKCGSSRRLTAEAMTGSGSDTMLPRDRQLRTTVAGLPEVSASDRSYS